MFFITSSYVYFPSLEICIIYKNDIITEYIEKWQSTVPVAGMLVHRVSMLSLQLREGFLFTADIFERHQMSFLLPVLDLSI